MGPVGPGKGRGTSASGVSDAPACVCWNPATKQMDRHDGRQVPPPGADLSWGAVHTCALVLWQLGGPRGSEHAWDSGLVPSRLGSGGQESEVKVMQGL